MTDEDDIRIEHRSQRLYLLGANHMYSGELALALHAFRKSLKLRLHHRTLQAIGECYLLMQRPDRAIVPLAASVTLDKHPRAPALLADAFFKLRDFTNAKRFAELTLERMPHYKRARKLIEEITKLETAAESSDA